MINYIVYKVSLLNKAKEEQLLNRFNGENDLLEICNQYYNSLRKNNEYYIDNQGNKRVFSISSKIDFLRTERTLVTKFDLAYTGDEPEIRNADTNALIHKVSKTELIARKLFSLCYIPKNSKYGFVVFETKANHGVKVMFERLLQTFLDSSGYEDYRVALTPALNYNYLSNFIIKGKLKKIRLIKNTFKEEGQLSLFGEDLTSLVFQYAEEMKFKNKREIFIAKNELYNLFFSELKEYDKINFRNNHESDDVSFEISYNGSTKIFYIKDRSRMRPIINVSKLLEYADGEPLYNSMIEVAMSSIREILGFNSLDLDEAA